MQPPQTRTKLCNEQRDRGCSIQRLMCQQSASKKKKNPNKSLEECHCTKNSLLGLEFNGARAGISHLTVRLILIDVL